MITKGAPRSERETQGRVIGLFTDPARPDNLLAPTHSDRFLAILGGTTQLGGRPGPS